MRKRVLSFLALAVAIICGSRAWAMPPVWIVRDADSEMILFGSVHVLPPGLTWRPEILNKALPRADDIWFEIPVDPVAAGQVEGGHTGPSDTVDDALNLIGRGVGFHGNDQSRTSWANGVME